MNEQRRTIKFFVKEKRKRPRNMISSRTIYSIYLTKKIVIKPAESIQIDGGITVTLPGEIHAMVTILPTVLNRGLKHKNNNDLITDTGHLILHLQNQFFSKKFTFNKNNFLGLLIVLNEILNETLLFEYHTEKGTKEKGQKSINFHILKM